MNKLACFLVLVLILGASGMAVSSKVMVLKLNYNNGNITLLNSTQKYGFFPDRRYQPDYGYRTEIISFEDSLLYEFRFKAPNEIFVDGTDDDGEISGGKVVLDNVNFALSVPYYDGMREINIYSLSDDKIASFSFEEERNVSLIKFSLVGLIAVVTIVLIMLVFIRHKKHNNR